MGQGFITRRGGIAIGNSNFTVMAGLILPSSGKDNDIFVKSDIPVNNVIMGVARPATANPGDVFLDILYREDNTTINIGVDKIVNVTIGNVVQWTGTAWVLRDSWVWRQGGWIELIYKLYDNGNEYINLTGGYTIARGREYFSLTKRENSLYFYSNQNVYTYSSCFSSEKTVDFSKFSKIAIEFKKYDDMSPCILTSSNKIVDGNVNGTTKLYVSGGNSASFITNTLTLSDKGVKFVGLGAYGTGSYAGWVEIKSVILRKEL